MTETDPNAPDPVPAVSGDWADTTVDEETDAPVYPINVVVGGQSYPLDVVEEAPHGVVALSFEKHGVQPVRVDGRNRRSDNDALEGGFCQVVDGRFKGRKGVFVSVTKHDPNTGYPTQVVVRTRDNEYQHLSVPYSSIRPLQTLRG